MQSLNIDEIPDLTKAMANPLFIRPETSLEEAILTMTKVPQNLVILPNQEGEKQSEAEYQPISCLLIIEEDKLIGILTERDLVKLAVTGDSGKQKKVKDVMTRDVIVLREEEFTDLFIVYSLMRRHNIRHLPIVNENGYPVGIVTPTSLRYALSLSYFLRFRKIGEVMNSFLITAPPSASVFEIASLMTKNRVSCVILVETKEELIIPVGIITERDIVQFQAMQLDLSQIIAKNVMSQPLFCLSPDDTLAKAHLQMQELKTRRLVITGKQGELLGLVTQSSLSQILDPIEIYGVLEILQNRIINLEKSQLKLLKQQNLELNQALKNNEFELYYQPQICLKTGQLMGAEALIRWNHPQKGQIPPSQFIPLAEETGLIVELGDWILKTVCFQAKQWQNLGYPPLELSANLSSQQLNQLNFVDKIRDILEETQLEPHYLKLELTESLLVTNIETTIEIFKSLRNLGVKIAIDDFGTGYASLGYLQHFSFDTLKIDRCFVQNVDQNQKNAAITTTIIAMAHRLNFQVVAEGVETEAEKEFLKSNKCDVMQGYLFSPPLPVNEFTKMLNKLFNN
jgi:EAL domain-containing protein (putative c-di-GMP-specific phosphodiesterase class I)/CBS domain-containing protein